MQLQLHYKTLHYTNYITPHYSYNYTYIDTALHYTHYTLPHYSTQHYSTLQYATLTRYTLDRRPWHEMGFSAKNSMFFDVPHFALFQTTANFMAFFSSLFQKLFQLF